jgi:hypothetical protein
MKHDSTLLCLRKPPFNNNGWNFHLWLETACFVPSHATNLLNTLNV